MRTALEKALRELGWQRLNSNRIGELQFSELWQYADDPLTLLIVQEVGADPRLIQDLSLRIENLAWTLHAHDNRRLLTAIMIVEGGLDPEAHLNLRGRLSRFCRPIFLSSTTDPIHLKSYLLPLNRKLSFSATGRKSSEQPTPIASVLLADVFGPEIRDLIRDHRTAEGIQQALQNELQRRAKRVIDALTESFS